MRPAQQTSARAQARSRLILMLAERLVREHQADVAKLKATQSNSATGAA